MLSKMKNIITANEQRKATLIDSWHSLLHYYQAFEENRAAHSVDMHIMETIDNTMQFTFLLLTLGQPGYTALELENDDQAQRSTLSACRFGQRRTSCKEYVHHLPWRPTLFFS